MKNRQTKSQIRTRNFQKKLQIPLKCQKPNTRVEQKYTWQLHKQELICMCQIWCRKVDCNLSFQPKST